MTEQTDELVQTVGVDGSVLELAHERSDLVDHDHRARRDAFLKQEDLRGELMGEGFLLAEDPGHGSDRDRCAG